MSHDLPFGAGHMARGPGRARPVAWVWVLAAAAAVFAALAGGGLVLAALTLWG